MLGDILNIIEKFENSEDFKTVPTLATIDGNAFNGRDLANYTSTPLSTHIIPNVAFCTEIASDSEGESSRPVQEGIRTDSWDSVNRDCSSVSSTSSDENYQPSPTAQDLKQSLKDKIKFRRESEGAGKLPDSNLFEPQRGYKLTEEEERKNQIRKERNRRSATKSRLKRIEREKNLQKEHESLEEEHSKLQNEVRKLQKELCILQRFKYSSHSPTCPWKSLNYATPLQSTSTSGPMNNCTVLQPTHIPLSALPDHLRMAAKLQMSGTSMKVDPRPSLENVQNILIGTGSVSLLKRKADDDLQQATMMPPFPNKSDSAKEVDEQGHVLPRAVLVDQNVNGEGRFGKTLPLSSSNIAPSMLRTHTDQMDQQLLSTSSASTTCFNNQFAVANSRNPTSAPIHDKSKERFSFKKLTVPSAESCEVQTINNTVTSSGWHSLTAKQILHSSATPVVTSSQSMDLTDVCNIDSLPSLDLESLTGLPYVISGSSIGQDDNSAAKIQFIKDHLLDDLDQKCSE